jgi:hypothetical protein
MKYPKSMKVIFMVNPSNILTNFFFLIPNPYLIIHLKISN